MFMSQQWVCQNTDNTSNSLIIMPERQYNSLWSYQLYSIRTKSVQNMLLLIFEIENSEHHRDHLEPTQNALATTQNNLATRADPPYTQNTQAA